MAPRLALAALSALILYFAFHAFAGEQGLGAWSDLQSEISDLKTEKARLETLSETLRQDIARLDPVSPDEEFVELLARKRLGYVRPGEWVVVMTHDVTSSR